VKNTNACARKFASLLKRVMKNAPAQEPAFPDADDPVAVLIQSFLLWESETEGALACYERLRDGFVDYNDLRVSLPYEIVRITGQTDPRALDRSQRLRAVLNDIYRREHAVNLDRLRECGKRDVRKYLDDLEGMVLFVAARTALLAFDSHAVPVDDQLRAQLIEEEAAEEGVDLAELAQWLSRQVKAADGRAAHFALQAWSDEADRSLKASAASTASGKQSRSTRKKKKSKGSRSGGTKSSRQRPRKKA